MTHSHWQKPTPTLILNRLIRCMEVYTHGFLPWQCECLSRYRYWSRKRSVWMTHMRWRVPDAKCLCSWIFTGYNEVVAKVMFFTRVCHSVHREGVSASVHAGIPHPLGADTPPEQTPPRVDTPQEQTPPRSRHPPGADPTWSRHSLGADTPQEQTPLEADTPTPWADTALAADTPLGADTPLKQTPQAPRSWHTHPRSRYPPKFFFLLSLLFLLLLFLHFFASALHPPPCPPPPGNRLRHTVNERPVRILLECILVITCFSFCILLLFPIAMFSFAVSSSVISISIFMNGHDNITRKGRFILSERESQNFICSLPPLHMNCTLYIPSTH